MDKTVLDLFCGCGGMSYGFKLAKDYNILAGIDYAPTPLLTYQHNFPNSKAICHDLSNPNFEELSQILGTSRIDVLVGGPPCQAVSLTGKRRADDPRNKLFFSFIEMLKYFDPKAFVMENVTGLVNVQKGNLLKEIVSEFKNIGYTLSYKVLNAADYGVPQFRKRVFFVGLKDKSFEFPQPTHGKPDLFNSVKPYVTCGEAWEGLPPLDMDEEKNYPQSEYAQLMTHLGNDQHTEEISNHIGTKHHSYVLDIIKMVPEGGCRQDLPEEYRNVRHYKRAYMRYSSNTPSLTVDTGHRQHFHFKYNRNPTVRENARLQSFPDSFVFLGKKVKQYFQVGNAVPPLLMKTIAEKLLRYL